MILLAMSGSYESLIGEAMNKYNAKNDARGAVNILKDAVKLRPNDSRAYQLLGFAYLNGFEHYVEVEKYMSKAIDLGGSAVFRVQPAHDPTFSYSCKGSLYISNDSPQFFVKYITSISTPEGKADFEGLMKVYQSNGKNYFIGEEKAVLESFGLQGLDDADNGEENPVVGEDDSGLVRKGVLNGTAISLPVPKYPKAARAANITGAVNVKVIIDKNGKVRSAEAVSGPPLLQKVSEEATMQAKFKPTILSGQPLEITGIIVYNFND